MGANKTGQGQATGQRQARKRARAAALLAAAALALAAAAAAIAGRAPQPAAVARIYQNGELLRVVDISAGAMPSVFVVDGKCQNTVESEPGRIRVANATCRDGICVSQGWLSGGLEPIVCLPNALVIQVEPGGAAAVRPVPDAVSK